MLSLVRLQWRRFALYYHEHRKVQPTRADTRGDTTHLDLSVRLQAEPLGDRTAQHASTPLALVLQKILLTGSGARPSQGCASCGKSFGKATDTKHSNLVPPTHSRNGDLAATEEEDAPSCLDVVRGGGGGGWRGEEN